jgi:flagellar basal-body rod protein FlgB
MNEMNDAALVSALRRQMTLAVARQVAAASNVANVDTPGYKAVQVSFADTLEARLASTPSTTHPGHLGGTSVPGARLVEQEGVAPRRDGNTVQLDQELLAMNRAAGDFSQAQTALSAKFRLVRYAISESR